MNEGYRIEAISDKVNSLREEADPYNFAFEQLCRYLRGEDQNAPEIRLKMIKSDSIPFYEVRLDVEIRKFQAMLANFRQHHDLKETDGLLFFRIEYESNFMWVQDIKLK